MQAETVPAMQSKVDEIVSLVASVQAYQFTPEKQNMYQQGLDKVAQQLGLVQAALAKNDLAQAKQLMAEVDSLKKQYHKERSPSFWQLIFGG
jgi:soluble cytochrome b562